MRGEEGSGAASSGETTPSAGDERRCEVRRLVKVAIRRRGRRERRESAGRQPLRYKPSTRVQEEERTDGQAAMAEASGANLIKC